MTTCVLVPRSYENKGRNETSFSNENLYTPVELFGIIAECEKLENPGEALLLKAKNLCWSILAMIAKNVGAAVEATNSLPANARTVTFHYNRKSAKRRRLMEPISVDSLALTESKMSTSSGGAKILGVIAKEEREKQAGEDVEASADTDDMAGFLSRMVAALCKPAAKEYGSRPTLSTCWVNIQRTFKEIKAIGSEGV
ncbi:hypothetical protein Fot_35499 [Forsythia ovata]|uniref:Uncharacterized protein n=1 Tax=Forsythia ovata TaxID=205694 RepID=A0ABD1SLP5_9LAMI